MFQALLNAVGEATFTSPKPSKARDPLLSVFSIRRLISSFAVTENRGTKPFTLFKKV